MPYSNIFNSYALIVTQWNVTNLIESISNFLLLYSNNHFSSNKMQLLSFTKKKKKNGYYNSVFIVEEYSWCFSVYHCFTCLIRFGSMRLRIYQILSIQKKLSTSNCSFFFSFFVISKEWNLSIHCQANITNFFSFRLFKTKLYIETVFRTIKDDTVMSEVRLLIISESKCEKKEINNNNPNSCPTT